MEQVYYWVGLAVVWMGIGAVGALAAMLVLMYVRGFYRAIKLTAWMVRTSERTEPIAKCLIIKNVFSYWNKMTWWGKNDTMSTGRGHTFYV